MKRTAHSPRFVFLFFFLLLLIACATTNEAVPSATPKPSPTFRPTATVPPNTTVPLRTATPTLRQYWDRAACFDLFDRIVTAQASGLSDEVIAESMWNAVGAVRRYGMDAVINHCYDKYSEAYERFLRGN